MRDGLWRSPAADPALLKAADINPGVFRSYLSDFGDSLPELFTRGQEIVDTLMKGAQLGFARFLDPQKLPGNILEIVLGWLAGDIGVKLPEKFDLASLGGFLLDLVGLTWDTVLDVAGEVIGPGNLGMLLEFVDTISAAMEHEGGILGWVNDLISKKTADFSFADVLAQVRDAAVSYAAEKLAVEGVKWASTVLASPAGTVVKALDIVYKAVKTLWDQRATFVRIYEAVVQGYKDVAGGSGPEKVAERVEAGIKLAARPILAFIMGQVGLGDLPKQVGETLGKVRAWLRDKMKRVAEVLLRPVREVFAKLGLGGKQSRKREWEVDGEKHSLWYDFEVGDIMEASSPQRYIERVYALRDRIPNLPNLELRTKAKELVEKARSKYLEVKPEFAKFRPKPAAPLDRAPPPALKAGKPLVPTKAGPHLDELAELVEQLQVLVDPGACPTESNPRPGEPYYDPSDPLGRPIKVVATLTPAEIRPAGSRADFKSGAWPSPGYLSRLPAPPAGRSWERGHFLASRLGGAGGENWFNMVPQYDSVNDPLWKQCESRIVEAVHLYGCVRFTATAHYTGSNLHPDYFTLEAVAGGKIGRAAFHLKVDRLENDPASRRVINCQKR